MRKSMQLPADVHQNLLDHLKQVESQQGFKISVTSWVAQAIREKIERDTYKENV